MVEYEKSTYEDWIKTAEAQPEFKPKVDKNNYITITKLKNSWSREEHISNIKAFAKEFVANTDTAYKQADIDNWILNNL